MLSQLASWQQPSKTQAEPLYHLRPGQPETKRDVMSFDRWVMLLINMHGSPTNQ